MAFHKLVITVIDARERSSVLSFRTVAGLGYCDFLTNLPPLFLFTRLVALVQRELRQIVISRSALIEGLVDVQLVGEDDDLVLWSFASRRVCALASVVRVVGVLELRLVRVAGGANHSLIVQRGFIFNSKLATCSNRDRITVNILKRLDIVDGEGERAISSGSSRVQSQGVLGRRNDGVAILNNKAISRRIS